MSIISYSYGVRSEILNLVFDIRSERRRHLRGAHTALTLFFSRDSLTEQNVVAICAPRSCWRRRLLIIAIECKSHSRFSNSRLNAKRHLIRVPRHLRGAHMATRFYSILFCSVRRFRISIYTDNQTERRHHMRSAQMAPTLKRTFSKKPKRRRHMRSAQMASTFKCTVSILSPIPSALSQST